MLIKCPECKLQVSDKALMCPHCGYPLSPQAKNISRPRNKRKRLPNGFGQISEIKGRNLRKPFRAMITVGKTETGHPISKPLKPVAYFETYNDAYTALMEYNKNPYELENAMTCQQLFDKWYEEKEKSGSSESTLSNYRWIWRQCKTLYDTEIRQLTISDLKKLILNKETSTQRRGIKNVFNLMLDFAVEGGIVDRNIARSFHNREKIKESDVHTNYTDEELELLWKHADHDDIDLILIQCYTGLRPSEIGQIELTNFDPDNMTAIGGLKTESGRNRLIIFHSRIQPFVRKRYFESIESGSKWLFSKNGKKVDYRIFGAIVNKSTAHMPHDGRVTFATMAKKAGVDEYVVKKLMGHRIDDLTERVYTKRDTEWLRQELEKIK